MRRSPAGGKAEDPCGHSVVDAERAAGKTVRRCWIPWATRLERVFQVDVMVCPQCSSRRQRIAVIHDPKAIQTIPDGLARKTQPP